MRISPEKMNEMFEQGEYKDLDEDVNFENELRNFSKSESGSTGSLKEGTIVKINDEFVMVDLNQKAESRMPLDEIKDNQGNLLFKEGDKIPVLFQRKAGVNISYKKALKYKKIQEKINRLRDDYKDVIIKGLVTKKNRGGLIVEKDGVDYFMPNNETGFKPEERVIGKKIKACVIDVKPAMNSIVISRRSFFAMNAKMQKEGAKELVQSGLSYEGVIKRINPSGLTVAIGNIDGFVHKSEISYKSSINPAKHYKEGDVVQVKPLSYDEEKNRLSLSIKALFNDPWKEVEKEIKVGYVIGVNVSNIEAYGAFVDLGNDVEGFLHISEVSWDKNVKRIEDYLSVGQEINVEVIEIDVENRRLRVSLKKQQEKPFSEFIAKYKEGSIIKGKVVNLMPFGVFVNFGKVDGLLHNDDAFWDKGKKCSDVFKIGDEIETRIEKIDSKNEKISLSYKYNVESPIDIFSKKYNLDDTLEGVVIDIKDFGVFVKINDETIDALIRNDDLGNIKKEDIKIGDSISAALAHVDKKNGKIRVSVKRLDRKKEKQELSQYNSNEKMTLGDALGDALKGK